jgi:hypothetical protein
MFDKDSNIKWEMFSLRGLHPKVQPAVAFACHYQLNVLQRASPYDEESLHPYLRKSDMVRCTGISLSFEMRIEPKSGFRLRVLLFQTPYELKAMTHGKCHSNHVKLDAEGNPQGYFEPNASFFTNIHKEDDGGYQVCIAPEYKNMFKEQRKTRETLHYDQIIHNLKLSHPMVTVLRDIHLRYVNRGNKPRMFKYNKLVPMKTTWKYPPVYHDGELVGEDELELTPDRKVYAMIIATPCGGRVSDPQVPMPGLDVDQDLEDADDRIQPYEHREVSVLSDAYDVKSEDKGKEPEVRRSARLRGGHGTPEPGEPSQHEPTGVHLEGAGGIYLDQMKDMFVEALALNRELAQQERERQKALDPKPPKPEKVGVDEFGWSLAQSMMLRPTFRLWWKDMSYRPYVKTRRFKPYGRRR